jgi:outer membrane receptor protein involved in Fe transport
MIKLISGYQWDNGLLVGGSLRADTGRPINRIADWPQNDRGYGKLFVTPRGEAGRLPSTLTINLHVEYAIKIKRSTLTLFADVLNLFNKQYEFTVDETFYQVKAHWSDPNIVNDSWGKTMKRTEPRAGAVGFRWSF